MTNSRETPFLRTPFRAPFRAWIEAIRPATLTASAVPVMVGTAAAARAGEMRLGPAAAALAVALLLQIGTNLANDADDFKRGADTPARRGPRRATQSGLLSAREVRAAAWATFCCAAVIGLYLAAIGGWPIVLLGAAAIVSGLAYTGGPWPFGYHGLGDVFVFAFFGIAAVLGTYYVQALRVDPLAAAASVPVGALATAILVVNNIRDIDTDRAAGKRTLAVRLGARGGRAEFASLFALAYATPAALLAGGVLSWWALLPWLSAPWAVKLCRRLSESRDGTAFNTVLRGTVRLHAAFGVLLAIGVLS